MELLIILKINLIFLKLLLILKIQFNLIRELNNLYYFIVFSFKNFKIMFKNIIEIS
jgi:hypothetical protein